MNAREQLEAAAYWLSLHDENLSYGLRAPEDAIKLWRFAQRSPELAEFCDQTENEGAESDWLESHFIAAIGYNPWNEPLEQKEP